MNESILSRSPPYSIKKLPLCFMFKSLFKLEIARSPNCANIDIIVPRNKHFTIEKSMKNFSETQIRQDVIRFAIAPPTVLLGLISGANFIV